MAEPTPKHRRFRFGTRTLFVAITLFAIPLAYLAAVIRSVHDATPGITPRYVDSVNTAPIPGPPMPPIEKFGLHEGFDIQVAERLTANREGLAEFLPTMIDVATVQAATPRFQQFEVEYRDTVMHRPSGGLALQESIEKIYQLQVREWEAQEKIKTELKRIEAIPDASRILELGRRRPDLAKPRDPRSRIPGPLFKPRSISPLPLPRPASVPSPATRPRPDRLAAPDD